MLTSNWNGCSWGCLLYTSVKNDKLVSICDADGIKKAGNQRAAVGSRQTEALRRNSVSYTHLLDIDTCWMTFTASDKIKKALSLATPLEVAAIVAFGYGEKTAKKLRLNILSMSHIDVQAEQQYYAPKKG